MLRYLLDPANSITAAGLLCSAGALYLAMAGRPELAVAAALWAVLADHLDGVVARRSVNRAPDMARMGKSLDSFADLVYGAVVPALLIIELSQTSVLSYVTASALLLAGALRLSYFNNFGLSSSGRFTGVPLSYDVPLLAAFMLARYWIPPEHFTTVLNLTFLALAALHVASIPVPSLSRAMYGVVTLYSVSASAVLAFRGLA